MCNWLVCILSALCLITGAQNAHAGQYQNQKLVYDVYAGGFHVVRADVDVDLSKKGRYSIFLKAHTRGFLGSLAPWKGTFESHGWVVGEQDFRPELHKSVTTWRDEQEIKEYKYTKTNGFQELVITDHERPAHSPEIDPALTKDTTDTLTAGLHVFEAVGNGQSCDDSMDVFDGKRRFSQVFQKKSKVELSSSKYNVYNGPALKCTVEVTPVAGKWHSKPRGWMSIQEQGREKGTMPTVWLASISEGAPAVPVKIMVKTDYGALMMHLVEYHNDEGVLLAEKQADMSED